MCLTTLDKTTRKPRYAWKVLRESCGRTFTPFFNTLVLSRAWNRCNPSGKGRIKASNYARIREGKYYQPSYARGFHCWVSRRVAQHHANEICRGVVVRVELRRIVASGTQDFSDYGGRVIVARSLRICKNQKG